MYHLTNVFTMLNVLVLASIGSVLREIAVSVWFRLFPRLWLTKQLESVYM